MLDTATKHRIDTARDILVGKVPDPKSQVEQITIALIYKFMDDMDAEAEELGGKRTFFSGDFAKFGWAKLLHASLGGHEMLALYATAIENMPQNPGVPQLFRDIFKNAYLPYKDPETLRAFLTIIDEFTYDHSERLGDAFEYLLSVLGSQGDAGQFRTPRHIIDFMIEIVDPQKHESVLDPACGTAGFLISSYKHILRANTDKDGTNTLTPDEREHIAQNFMGYDISPDMVRLSLANMYLHGFTQPHIYEYDTLTSQERWTDYADVILANPPFMSPKGGIKPHNRFSVQSKRSEVLFVDYMVEHLKPTGRAAIIVPEGIIFQSQNAYKQLRKMLVEDSLVAVVSLPAGVFNPYSGVKTSILILDKALAQHTDSIAFIKIENDGYGLGAQRRATEKNDLPAAAAFLADYFSTLREQTSPTKHLLAADKTGPYSTAHSHTATKAKPEAASSATPDLSDPSNLSDHPSSLYHIVPKAKIAANGDYNLSGERYVETIANVNQKWPLVSLGEKSLFRIEGGGTPKSTVEEYWGGGVAWATLVDLPATDFITQITETKRTISDKGLRNSSAKMMPVNSIIVSTRATIGRIAINRVPIATNQGFKNIVIKDANRALPEYVALAATRLVPTMKLWATGGTFAEISKSKFCELQIPLPPLDIQKQIVAEIEGYQKIIDGARAVIENYRPHIDIDPSWPMVDMGDHFTTTSGGTPSKAKPSFWIGDIPWVSPKDMKSDLIKDTKDHISKEAISSSTTKLIPAGTVVCVVRSGILKHSLPIAVLERDMCINQDLLAFFPKTNKISSKFLFYVLKTNANKIILEGIKPGVTVQSVYNGFFKTYQVPLPTFDTQQSIIAEIEAEQALIAANHELITRFKKKIQAVLSKVWGE